MKFSNDVEKYEIEMGQDNPLFLTGATLYHDNLTSANCESHMLFSKTFI